MFLQTLLYTCMSMLLLGRFQRFTVLGEHKRNLGDISNLSLRARPRARVETIPNRWKNDASKATHTPVSKSMTIADSALIMLLERARHPRGPQAPNESLCSYILSHTCAFRASGIRTVPRCMYRCEGWMRTGTLNGHVDAHNVPERTCVLPQ